MNQMVESVFQTDPTSCLHQVSCTPKSNTAWLKLNVNDTARRAGFPCTVLIVLMLIQYNDVLIDEKLHSVILRRSL